MNESDKIMDELFDELANIDSKIPGWYEKERNLIGKLETQITLLSSKDLISPSDEFDIGMSIYDQKIKSDKMQDLQYRNTELQLRCDQLEKENLRWQK